ncbi:hypothetical protein MNBD_GAMMA26-1797 [hydrothermal vent metagenome]|uniref:Uncharacterized protein n=1 Tax=hydrothermal vent metagenome TaxID=652676 RepID=A0A3B1BGM6_9ZZZZ
MYRQAQQYPTDNSTENVLLQQCGKDKKQSFIPAAINRHFAKAIPLAIVLYGITKEKDRVTQNLLIITLVIEN